ncbi:NHL repeat-containing protein [Carboxydothermus hydrogenoformans]|uniref:NHL repeat protein n=1 Tax=Carboxydothermus hydrogenoformans (strain ATCC BAA-161 / DSM 6008 / Z-2901) TaxID=246194 RepID=Q3AD77_CARHZ|nr:NHL repeat-containing protein [Carboxydothermus hydrogenoformans]ABB14492.1 NHL repeat protein [Carboxydothermus hydrogenoformans Z-2901]
MSKQKKRRGLYRWLLITIFVLLFLNYLQKIKITDFLPVVTESSKPLTPFLVIEAYYQEKLAKPCGVFIRDAKIYVTDGARKKVYVFETDGTPVACFGQKGEFTYPWSVYVDSEGKIYVSDLMDGVIKEIDPESGIIRELGAEFLKSPMGIWIEGDKMFVADANQRSVILMDKEGRYLKTLTKNGDLVSPSYLQVVGDELFVTDAAANRVVNGKMEESFTRVFGDGYLLCPRGIAVFADTIVVANTLLNRIDAFSATGKYLWSFGEKGHELNQMFLPTGIAYAEELLAVADQGNGRVVVYNIEK